jgi:hypothetical protein
MTEDAELLRAVRALMRRGLRETGHDDDLDRLAAGEWHIEMHPDQFVVRWNDGALMATVNADVVAAAIGLLRAGDDAKMARLN